MLGQIELENFKGLTQMPQKAASAWGAVDKIIGAKYVPLLYVGKQLVHGTNHYFLAEQTLTTSGQERSIVTICINESGGKFVVVPHSVAKVF